jgi:hypothetical protein
MWELIRDPVWQFVGAAVGLVGTISAVVLGVVIYRLQRRRKALSYELLTQTRLVKVEEGYDSAIEILYEGQSVADVSLITLKIVNSGNLPITEDDYEMPAVWTFGEEARVLSADVMETDPTTLQKMEHLIALVKNDLVLGTWLLNPGDSITVKLLVSGFGGEISASGRIAGVKDLQMVKRSSLVDTSTRVTAVLFLVGFAMGMIIAWIVPDMGEAISSVFIVLIIAGGATLLAYRWLQLTQHTIVTRSKG